MKFYLIGIKGSAMSALAKILLDMNFYVRGCDAKEDFEVFLDIKDKVICDTFDDVKYSKDYYYIIGNAYTDSLVTKKIINNNYKYEFYPKFINNLFTLKKIAVSASHGKTTICKLICHLLEDRLIYLIGDGSGKYKNDSVAFLFEACEYKKTFLNYFPDIAIINNIDYDHPDFFKTKEDYIKTFGDFSKQSKLVIYNGDDVNCKNLNCENKMSYGLKKANDVVCSYIITKNGYDITIKRAKEVSKIALPFYGKHMIYNFLAAFCICKLFNVSDDFIQQRLNSFEFPKRRNQKTILNNKIVICDYAHHPTEIKAFFEVVNLSYKDYKKIIIFQSHTNSRSEKFKTQFKEVLSLFDETYYVDVFSSAREKKQKDFNEGFFKYLNYPKYNFDIKSKLLKEKNAVICFVGAGDIDVLCKEFIKGFHENLS